MEKMYLAIYRLHMYFQWYIFLNSLAFKFDRKHYLVCIFIKVVLIPFWFPSVNMGPSDLYQIPKNNDTIISKMEVLGINKKSLNILDMYFFI